METLKLKAGQIAVGAGLFAGGHDGPYLLASGCGRCGARTFPRQPGCPRCLHSPMDDLELEGSGTLWTWTVQGFPPKSPPYRGDEPFEPYGVGYIELSGGPRVESRLTVADPGQLSIGMRMWMKLIPFGHDSDGNALVTFAFGPEGTRA